MPNPYLPLWEYIPDGEPRVFGDRVYIYGSHDNAGSDKFCDYKLKVWSAPFDDLNNWTCHGHIFHTRDDRDHKSDTIWTDSDLYAPDVVEKDGKYYLYAYIMNGKGCVAVSDRPEGPFKLISQYKYNIPKGKGEDCFNDGWFIDPGVLVDDDGKVYIYCGYERSFVAQINPDNMYEIIDGTYQDDIIPIEEPLAFFEACSPRKIKDTYYLIYSPKIGSRLAYATSKYPTGPFEYRGTIVDNGIDYPGGNDHGSICNINNQWYIFYHRMTNGTVMSRRGCVEKIEILPDGTIPEVEMTSLGFEDSLSPYKITPAEIACVLKGSCFITEKNVTSRPITAITSGCIIGYKYFDFGKDFSSKTMKFSASVKGTGCKSKIRILLDNCESGQEHRCR
jgi:arabinoxylan arabinofuranohydrolase